MATTFRVRRDTAANWTSVNPVLSLGEPALETDTRKTKYGDGVTAWNSLGYSVASASVTWGSITGTLSSQTDLTSALSGKLSAASNLSDVASVSTARTNLGLGTMATQSASSVAITGGSVTGITPITVANGGTGASSAATARTNLGVTATGSDTNYAYRANNLSDLSNAATALTNLKAGSLTHPGYVSGRYYWPVGIGTMNLSVAPGLNTLRLSPVVFSQPVTISELWTRIITASAGGNCRFGIYAADATTKWPSNTPLATTGNVSTTSAVNVNGAISAGTVTLPAGLYWFGVMADNATVAVQASAQTAPRFGVLIGSTTMNNMESATNIFYDALSTTVSFGSWPNLSVSPPTESIQAEVAIGFKAA